MSFTEVTQHRGSTSPSSSDNGETLLARTADLLGRLGPDTVKNIDTILDGACSFTRGRFAFYVETAGPAPVVLAHTKLPRGLARDIEHSPSLFTHSLAAGKFIIPDNIKADCLVEKYRINALLGVAVTGEMNPSGILWVGDTAPLEFGPGHVHALKCLAGALGTQLRLAKTENHRHVAKMAAQTAHDLNNILSGLVSYPELMLLQLEPGSPLKEPVSFIHESGLLASDLVQDFLFLARPRYYTPSPIDPESVARPYFSGSAHAALKATHPHVRFSFSAEEHLGPIHISELFLTRIIAILVAHATHGALPGSRVELILDRPHPDRVRLRVMDDGSPMSKENIANIFKPFYTRKVMGRPGSGLGFPVVQKIVDDHGGRITVEHLEGKGNLIEIHFPARTLPASA